MPTSAERPYIPDPEGEHVTPIIQKLLAAKSLLRTGDLATITSLARRTIARHALAGRIPGAIKLGGIWLFNPSIIAQWLKCSMRLQFRMTGVVGETQHS